MLILTRQPGQRLIISDDIKVAILGIYQNQIKIGIDAPKQISIHREEVYQKILAQKTKFMEHRDYLPIVYSHYEKA